MKIKTKEKNMKKAEILFLCVYKSILIKKNNFIYTQILKN